MGLRALLLLSVLALPTIIAASEACSTDPAEAQVGQLGQACYPNNTCAANLVCFQMVYDGGFTDGGQCYYPIQNLTDVEHVPDVADDVPTGSPDAADGEASGPDGASDGRADGPPSDAAADSHESGLEGG
jgi:hypothetical protein